MTLKEQRRVKSSQAATIAVLADSKLSALDQYEKLIATAGFFYSKDDCSNRLGVLKRNNNAFRAYKEAAELTEIDPTVTTDGPDHNEWFVLWRYAMEGTKTAITTNMEICETLRKGKSAANYRGILEEINFLLETTETKTLEISGTVTEDPEAQLRRWNSEDQQAKVYKC